MDFQYKTSKIQKVFSQNLFSIYSLVYQLLECSPWNFSFRYNVFPKHCYIVEPLRGVAPDLEPPNSVGMFDESS